MLTLAIVSLCGCGGSEPQSPRTSAAAATSDNRPARATTPPNQDKRLRPKPRNELAAHPDDQGSVAGSVGPKPRNTASPRTGPTSLADLLNEEANPPSDPQPIQLPATGRIPIDGTKLAVAGIRRLPGRHLTLYTDVPPAPEVDNLPDVFDLAVGQWCQYFAVDPTEVLDWKMTGFLVRDKNVFISTGLIPSDLPPFLNGFQRGAYLWVNDQPTDFYRRHLLLHEGTHAFMEVVLGGFGPPWYSEGLAEYLGTHRWSEGQLTLRYMPSDKSETPGWGRIRIVKDELASGRGMLPEMILNYDTRAHLKNEPYGWCWAIVAFLDNHPRFQEAFRQLAKHVRDGDLNRQFRQQTSGEWEQLIEDWQVFVMDLDYGYDIARAAISRKQTSEVPPNGVTVSGASDRGWQSSGVRLRAGRTYRLRADGRFQIAQTDQPWWCEAGGVTIHYHTGRPLGQLLGAIRDETQPLSGLSPLVKPDPIGLETTWTPTHNGTLFVKINEAAGQLADNRGELSLRIQAVAPESP